MRLSWMSVVLLAAVACSRASDESGAKRSPKGPPPPSVDIDGKPAPPITHDRLAALKPDFADGDRSAWKLSALLGAAFDRPGAMVEAVSAEGQGVALHRPDSDRAPQPVLFLTRRGELVAAVVDPDQPFPAYHGQGGQLQRPGDRRPRLSGVVKMSLRVEAAGGGDGDRSAAGRKALAAVELAVGDQVSRLTDEQIAGLPRLNVQGDEGDQRAAWSLRDLVAVAGGPKARAAAVVGESGRVAIAPERWSDATLTPILRANRRGELKLMWINASGVPQLEGEVRAIERIEIAQ